MSARIAYRAVGSGPAVVLVHGVGGGGSNWDEIAPQLSSRFRVIVLDLRGHGRSAPITGACTLEDFARDVTEVMDAVGAATARIVGFSLGGMVAQSVALDAPQRVEKLVLIGTSAGRNDAERARLAGRMADLRSKGVAHTVGASRDVWFTEAFQKAHPEKVEARVRQLLESDARSYEHAYGVFATADLGGRLGEIGVPTLIITGEHDLSGTVRMAQLMHERIRGSQLRILPGLRHSLLIESPQQIASLLAAFL